MSNFEYSKLLMKNICLPDIMVSNCQSENKEIGKVMETLWWDTKKRGSAPRLNIETVLTHRHVTPCHRKEAGPPRPAPTTPSLL